MNRCSDCGVAVDDMSSDERLEHGMGGSVIVETCGALRTRMIAALRDAIQRQVDTTTSGQRLVAYDAAAVQNLVDNLVGNVFYVIVEFKNS